MSRSRIAINVVLVLILAGFLWILGRAWLRSNPERLMNSAEQELAEGDVAAAKVHLMNFLRDVPDSSVGHELMSKVLLKEAAAEGRPDDSLLTNTEARDHLQRAARLAPDNVELHHQLLEVFLDGGALEAAAEVAEILIKTEPENPEALLALFRQSVAAGDFSGGEQRLAALRAHPSRRFFLQAQFEVSHFRGPEHAEQLAAVLDAAVKRAGNTTAEQLVQMSQTEQLAIPDVMQQAIAKAPDVKTAQHRASVALGICEKIAGSGQSNAAELSRFAADIMRVMRGGRTQNQATPEQRQASRDLEKRADVFLQAGIDSGTADASVYLEAALAAFGRRNHEEARGTLEAAIARFRDLPPERQAQLLTLKLLAARNLFVMRRYADAKPYLEALMEADDKEFKGWGALLSGAIASAEGRQQSAYKNYLLARQYLGQNPLVSMALANTHIQLRQWEEALPLLKYLEQITDASDVEQQAWAQMYQMFSEQIHWNEFRAHVSLNQWEEAEVQMKALQGTSLEPRVAAVAALHVAEEAGLEAGLEQLEAARQRFPNDLTLLTTQIALLARSGNSDAAMQAIEQLTERKDLPSQIFLARWRLRQNRPEEALQILTRLEEQYPDNPLPKLLKSRVLLAQGKAEEALEISEQLRESPQTARVAEYLELSQFLRENKLEEATEKLEQIEADAPTVTPRMNLLAGSLAAAQGELGTAIEKVGDTLDVTSLQGQSRMTLLRALLVMAERDGPDKAAAKLAPLLERYPDDAFLRLTEADLQFKQGRFDEGLRALERVEALLPGRPVAAYIKASVYAQRGDVDNALAEAKRAVAIDPNYVNGQQLAATLSLAQGKFVDAARYAAKALELNGRAWQMYLVLAEALQRAGRPQQAAETLEKAIELEPRFLAAYRGLAALHLTGGKPELARQVLQKAQQVAPEAFQLFVDEIAVLAQQKKLDEAEQLARQAVGEPADVGKSLAVARTMLSVGQSDAARKWATDALAQADAEQKPACELLLGEIALLQANENDEDRQLLEESRDHFAEVIKVQPDHFVAGNNLAWLLVTEFGQPQEALAVIEKVRGDAKVSQLPIGFIDTLAEVYRGAGRVDEALEMLQEAVELYPQNGLILFHLGMALADAGQTSAAVNSLERALQIGGLSDERKAAAQDMLASLGANAP